MMGCNSIYSLLIVCILFSINCSSDKPVSGIEVTNGQCIGKVIYSDGTAASGAVVRLIPQELNPTSPVSDSIDSTLTDINGKYTFKVSVPDVYNIIAAKATSSGLRDSIHLQPDVNTHLDDLVLDASGFFTGKVIMKPEHNPSTAVVLIRGTGIFALPDSTGYFHTSFLPQGKFQVRVFTTESGYSVYDTSVTLAAGEEIKLNVVIPTTDAPRIKELKADFDSALLYITLNWPNVDTSNILAFKLIRQTFRGRDTIFTLNKSLSSFRDDVAPFEGDSVTYHIAAIGKNYKEGYYTSSPISVVQSNVDVLDTIELEIKGLDTVPGLVSGSDNDIELAYNNDIVVLSDYSITRFSPSGTLLARYEQDANNPGFIMDGGEDDAGNWYFLQMTNDTNERYSIVKLNAGLEKQKQITYVIPGNFDRDQKLFVSGNGTVYLMSQSSSEDHSTAYHLSTFDSTLNLTTEFERQFQWVFGDIVRYGDTIVTRLIYNLNDLTQSYNQIGFLNFNFNILNTFSDYNFFSQYRIPYEPIKEKINQFAVFGGPYGTIISYMNHWVNKDNITFLDTARIFFVVSDGNNQLLSRKIINPLVEAKSPRFDRAGNIYFYHHDEDRDKLIIYKYSTGWLFPTDVQ